jgi:hypothetical protein
VVAAVALLVAAGTLPGVRAATTATSPVVPPWCGGDPAACLLPFPNDLFTVADPTTDTGRRVNLPLAGMPRNVAGVPIDPTEWNRNDGFSPGSMILTHVPGIDLAKTWGSSVDHIADLKRYRAKAAPMVLLDADTGKRHPFWSELDTHATGDDDRLLILRPAVNLAEGHRYIVALRRLRDADGSVIPAPATFAAYRDGDTELGSLLSDRRAHHEQLFAELGRAGIARSDLYLAWDFTVASERNLTERALHIRDDAFAALGDADLADGKVVGDVPSYEITAVTPQPDADTLRRVEGTIYVPNYLTSPQATAEVPDPVGEPLAVPQSRFNTVGSPDGLPVINPCSAGSTSGSSATSPPRRRPLPPTPPCTGTGSSAAATRPTGRPPPACAGAASRRARSTGWGWRSATSPTWR